MGGEKGNPARRRRYMIQLDYYDDGGEFLAQTVGEGRELAKVAARGISKGVRVDKADHKKFPDQEFALVRKQKGKVVGRYYPISDQANALVSMFYFLHTGKKLPEEVRDEVSARLLTALRKFGLKVKGGADLSKTASAEFDEVREPKARPQPKNFIVVRGANVGFDSRDQLEKLAASLAGQIGALRPCERRSVALQLLMHGVEAPDPLSKYAAVDENTSRQFLLDRRRAFLEAHRPDALSLFDTILGEQDLEKHASMLDQLDQEVCLKGHPDAFLTTFGHREVPPKEEVPEDTLEKVAAVMGATVRNAVATGNIGILSREHRRVLTTIMEE